MFGVREEVTEIKPWPYMVYILIWYCRYI